MAWQSLKISADETSAEILSDALMELGALAASIEDAHEGTQASQPIFGEPGAQAGVWHNSIVSALFPAHTDLAEVVAAAAQAAQLAPIPPYTTEIVEEQDWVRLTQSQFDPIQISPRLWIVPTWHTAPDPAALNLVLDPGLAFGTGSHPTTHLCLQWLDAHIKGGETVLDYGCGSGILAIAALKLGAAKAIGIDIDAQAIQASKQNAAQNGVAAEFFLSDDAPVIEADIVVANILANPLKVLAPMLARAVRSGGSVVLSGILNEQAEAVMTIYREWFDMSTPLASEGWVCVTGVKR